MASRMDEFRSFVGRYPLVREEVVSGKKTWQNIYEDWVMLGENNEIWKQYRSVTSTNSKPAGLENILKGDGVKNVWNYVKKINPDNVSKTLNTVQKVLQITQSFGTKPGAGLYNANYNSWWE